MVRVTDGECFETPKRGNYNYITDRAMVTLTSDGLVFAIQNVNMDPWPESSSQKKICPVAMRLRLTPQNKTFLPPPGSSRRPARYKITRSPKVFNIHQPPTKTNSRSYPLKKKKKTPYSFLYPTQQTNLKNEIYSTLRHCRCGCPGGHGCISCMQGLQPSMPNLQLFPGLLG